MCGKVCAQKTRLRAGKPAGKAWLSPGFLTRPGSRSCARSSHCPASLSHGPTGLWEPFPPAWPGKARPCQGSALRTACTPPQRRALTRRKTGGRKRAFSGSLTRPGSRSCARSSHCPASLSHGPTGPWEPFPPAWPGKARPCQGSALRTACTPPQRRALTRRKTGGQSLAFSGSLTHPGSQSCARSSHCPASFP